MGKYYKFFMKYIKSKAKIIKNGVKKVKKLLFKSQNSRNINGKKFEEKTSIESYLINIKKYEKVIYNPCLKSGFYLVKDTVNYKNIYTSQNGFKYYMNNKLNVPLSNLCRLPDEAFIQIPKNNSKSKKVKVYIVEKKHYTQKHRIDILMTGNEFKMEYQNLLGNRFQIEYGYVLNDKFFRNVQLKTLKNINLKNRLNVSNIPLFNGDKKEYKNLIYRWLNYKKK